MGKNGQKSIETVQKNSAASAQLVSLDDFFFRPFPTAEPGARLSS